jgi:hypothetical protein
MPAMAAIQHVPFGVSRETADEMNFPRGPRELRAKRNLPRDPAPAKKLCGELVEALFRPIGKAGNWPGRIEIKRSLP